MNNPELGAFTLPMFIAIAIGALIGIAILLWALIDAIRRPESKMRYLPKWAWILIILLGNTLGQLIYLFIGRDTSGPIQSSAGASADTARDAADALYGADTQETRR